MDAWSDDDDFVSAVKSRPANIQAGSSSDSTMRTGQKSNNKQQIGSDPKVQTSFSISSVLKIISRFGNQKKDLVRSMGFGGLLCLKEQRKFPRLLVLWIIRNMDPRTGEIKLPGGGRLTVEDRDVNLVLGIPHGGDPIINSRTLTTAELRSLKSMLMLRPGDELNLEQLKSIILRQHESQLSAEEATAFKLAFLIYVDAYFLAPKGTTVKINTDILLQISNTECIQELNWSGYVLRVLLQSADRVQRSLAAGNATATLDGCIIFWVVFYLDNLDFGQLNSDQTILPRMSVYAQDRVMHLCRIAKIRKLRDPAGVVYSRNIDSSELLSRAAKAFEGSAHTQQKEEIEEEDAHTALHEIMQWLNRVREETEYTKMKILRSFKKEYTRKKHSDSLTAPREEGRQAGESDEGSSTMQQKETTGELIEISSNDSDASKTIKTSDESCLGNHTRQDKTYTRRMGKEQVDYSGDLLQNGTDNQSEISVGCTSEADVDSEQCTDHYRGENMFGFHTSGGGANAVGNTSVDRARKCYGTLVGEQYFGTVLIDDGLTNDNDWPDSNDAFGYTDENTGNVAMPQIQEAGDSMASPETNYHAQESLLGIAMATEEFGEQTLSHNDEQHQVQTDGPEEYDFCPTPIAVIKPIHTDVVEVTRKNVMIVNDIEVDITFVGNLTKFGVSPFVINLTHKDSELECIFRVQKAIAMVEESQKKIVWYMHTIPSVVALHGHHVERMMMCSEDYTIDVIDALVRLYQQMDDQMYERWSEKRWRHFLPTGFAVAALNPDIHLASSCIKDFFIGSHISYDVGGCRLVIAAVMVHWHWCLYVWDFEKNKVIILDPVSMGNGSDFLENKHCKVVSLMHDAMQHCNKHFFREPYTGMETWSQVYLDIKGASGCRNDSGLYTMFYARYFDGEVLTRILTKESTKGHRANMVCQLLKMEGNLGQPPLNIVDAMCPSTE